MPRLGKRVHLDALQVIARVLRADQGVEREGHPLHMDVLPAVPHRARHVHQDARRAGLLRVLWITMSSDRIRTPGPERASQPRAARSIAFTNDCGTSMFATESPNSYCFVAASSTTPSPAIGPTCRPDRAPAGR